MKTASMIAVAALLAGSNPAFAQSKNEKADVAAVVAAVKATLKAKETEFDAFCASGPDSIRRAVTEAATRLSKQGKLKGNPTQVGPRAGAKIGQLCKG